ncbi:MAG: ComF family protein [Candidatus Kaelpia imicola]|nr:ComF family protein [Candidatus Kaelpia imicola]
MHTLLSNAFKALEEIIQPKYCIFCMNKIPVKETGFICQDCKSKIEKNPPPFCNRCGRHTYNKLCRGCLSKDKRDHFKAYYLFQYRGLIQDGLQRFKYRRALSLLNYLSEELYLFLKEEILPFEKIDFISYVPLHRRKLKEREFNQAELLARAVSKRTNITLLKKLLLRKIYTTSQSKLSKEERRVNIDGVFKVNLKYKNIIRNSKVLLIDDIITTGSTTIECIKELERLGSKTIVLAAAGG